MKLSAVVVPHICNPITMQPIATSKFLYSHIAGPDLADPGDIMGSLEIDVLIGVDHYWRIVTGTLVSGSSGPTAIETKLGWVLSGPFVMRTLPSMS